MNNQDLVSVIIPAHNAEKRIGRALDSVVRQDYPNFEIIVVLNGCTDETPNICFARQKQSVKIRVVENEVKGVFPARKRGVFEAWGKYITFMDSDDRYVNRKALSEMHRAISEDESQICQFGMYFGLNSIVKTKSLSEITDALYEGNEGIGKAFLGMALGRDNSFNGSVWSKIYDAKMLRHSLSGRNENFFWGEDLLLNAYAVSDDLTKRISSRRAAYYVYRPGGGTSKEQDYGILRNYIQYKDALEQVIDEKEMGEPFYLRMHSESLYCYRAVLVNMIRTGHSKEECLKAIQEIDGFGYVRRAKIYFQAQSNLETELVFMSGNYDPEQYYEYCCGLVSPPTAKDRIRTLINRIMG